MIDIADKGRDPSFEYVAREREREKKVASLVNVNWGTDNEIETVM